MLKLIAAVALVVAIGAATYALAGGDKGHVKHGQHEKQMRHEKQGPDGREGHGPPSWAPAHGWRCKEAGKAPGSPAFKDCIRAKKQ
jgi:hypothetical protein